jgi:hypothetical protein
VRLERHFPGPARRCLSQYAPQPRLAVAQLAVELVGVANHEVPETRDCVRKLHWHPWVIGIFDERRFARLVCLVDIGMQQLLEQIVYYDLSVDVGNDLSGEGEDAAVGHLPGRPLLKLAVHDVVQ